jgi:putative ABC transport system substrate-binding protein
MRRRDFITLVGGIAVGWPLAAHAQRSDRIPIIGVLWHARDAEQENGRVEVLERGLADLGWVVGKNVKVVHTFAGEDYSRFAGNAAGLAKLPVDIIVAVTRPAALAAKTATTKIPIVFLFVFNPVESQLVESLNRPGGNLTGLSNISVDLSGKKLEFLNEATGVARVALLTNTSDWEVANRTVAAFRASADILKITLTVFDAPTANDIEGAFDAIAQSGVRGVVLQVDSMFLVERKRIAQLALSRRLAIMSFSEELAEDGVMMSYGPNPFTAVRRAATYVDKILKGTEPADLPVEQPTKVDIVINAGTAKQLGFTMPASLLVFADRVID